MAKQSKQSVPGRNGGVLHPQEAGQPAHSPNVGRKSNPYRETIRYLAETEKIIILKGRILDANGNPTGKLVPVAVSLPTVHAIVIKAMNQAVKGKNDARKWLSETGYGKTLNLGQDDDSPLFDAVKFVVEDRRSKTEDDST